MTLGGARWWSLVYALIPILAVLTTWVTGLVQTWPEQGFPLAWKTGGVCPPIEIPCLATSYNRVAFILDVLVYTSIGYAISIAYKRL